MSYTIGIDIGSGAVKSALFRVKDGEPEWLAKRCERIRRRDPMTLAQEGRDGVLEDAGLAIEDIDYIATTGEGENVKFSTGHFYSMTTHARGGVFLHPGANAVAAPSVPCSPKPTSSTWCRAASPPRTCSRASTSRWRRALSSC